ncbi:hypothetical protein PR048_011126 [Dryococelus australis]|uniref:Integrase catalytic domain-containing protein n=1 Tax=Dryococelus australis TaxID=614101 RepID=A0ABQ9HKX6_9NEOP|nr:hypothetical protein PR048_011126 [Dryococelus australis]
METQDMKKWKLYKGNILTVQRATVVKEYIPVTCMQELQFDYWMGILCNGSTLFGHKQHPVWKPPTLNKNKMASCSSQSVQPILSDNSGFCNWKFYVRLVLDEKQLLETTEINVEDIAEDKDKKEFLKKDAKAKSVIVQCLPDKYLDLVKDARRAKDMLKSLEEVFERKSMFSKLYLKKKLLALKFKPKEKLEEHFLCFDGLVRDLENAGAKMDDMGQYLSSTFDNGRQLQYSYNCYRNHETRPNHGNEARRNLEKLSPQVKPVFGIEDLATCYRRGLQVLNLPFSEEKCPQCLEATKEGERYFQVIVGDFSRFTTVYLLKTKSEAEENLMNFIKMVKTQHEVKSKRIRLDNGIIIEYTTPYTTQQNSKAERMNLTLMNKVRAKFAETDLPCTLWGEAVRSSAYELNRSPTSALQNRTPASVLFGENDLSKLRVFGSQAYMLKLSRESKLEARAKPMIMDKIVRSRDVTFNESKVGVGNDTARYQGINIEEENEHLNGKDSTEPQTKKRTKEANQIEPSRRETLYHLQEYELYMASCLCAGEPQDYEDAIKLAFLNGYVDDICIKTSDVVKNEPGKVLKLKRSLYGLRSAPRKWNERFDNFMETHGMKRSASDFCLYVGVNIPVVCDFQVDTEEPVSEKFMFRQLIDSLMYVASVSMPEISYSICNQTQHLCLTFKPSSDDKLACYSDSDWAGDKLDRRSVNGCVLLLGQNIISWGSRKQGTVALSTAEAEYIACYIAACDLVYVQGVLQDFQSATSTLVVLIDNQSAIDMAGSFENKGGGGMSVCRESHITGAQGNVHNDATSAGISTPVPKHFLR